MDKATEKRLVKYEHKISHAMHQRDKLDQSIKQMRREYEELKKTSRGEGPRTTR